MKQNLEHRNKAAARHYGSLVGDEIKIMYEKDEDEDAPIGRGMSQVLYTAQ